MSQHASNFTSDDDDPTLLSRRDMQMARRAAREGWPVPMRLKQKIVDKLEERIDTSELESPWFDTAVSAVLKMTEQNIEAEKKHDTDQPTTPGVQQINNYFGSGDSPEARLKAFGARMTQLTQETGPDAQPPAL